MADNILPEWRAVRDSTTDADGFTWSTVTFEGFNGYSPSSGGDHVISAGADTRRKFSREFKLEAVKLVTLAPMRPHPMRSRRAIHRAADRLHKRPFIRPGFHCIARRWKQRLRN